MERRIGERVDAQVAAITRVPAATALGIVAPASTAAATTLPAASTIAAMPAASPSAVAPNRNDGTMREELEMREDRLRLLPISDTALRASTIAGNFHPLHMYRRRPASSAFALAAASAPDSTRTHIATLTTRREVNEAFLFGLLPLMASPPEASSPTAPDSVAVAVSIGASRLRDHLLFFTDMQTAFDLYPFTAVLDFIEMARHDAMRGSALDFRLCRQGTRGNVHWDQLRLYAASAHRHGDNLAARPVGSDPGTARVTNGLCRSFNAGACSARPGECKYRHACADCQLPGVARGHGGCVRTTQQTAGGPGPPGGSGGRASRSRGAASSTSAPLASATSTSS